MAVLVAAGAKEPSSTSSRNRTDLLWPEEDLLPVELLLVKMDAGVLLTKSLPMESVFEGKLILDSVDTLKFAISSLFMLSNFSMYWRSCPFLLLVCFIVEMRPWTSCCFHDCDKNLSWVISTLELEVSGGDNLCVVVEVLMDDWNVETSSTCKLTPTWSSDGISKPSKTLAMKSSSRFCFFSRLVSWVAGRWTLWMIVLLPGLEG